MAKVMAGALETGNSQVGISDSAEDLCNDVHIRRFRGSPVKGHADSLAAKERAAGGCSMRRLP